MKNKGLLYGIIAIAVLALGVIIYGIVAKKETKTGGGSTEKSEDSAGVLDVVSPILGFFGL